MIQNNLFITLAFSATILATIIVAFLVNRFFLRLIKKSQEDINIDPTNYKFLRHFVVVIIYIIGIAIATFMVPSLRTLASSMLAGAGILTVAIGFASQQALSNIISGIFVILFKPFRINDRVTIGTYFGVVEDITLRHTVIRDFENRRIVIPNSVISSETLINSDLVEDHICKWLEIGISYNSDIDLARKIIFDEVMNHPLHRDYRKQEDIDNGVPEVIIRVIDMLDSAIQIRAWIWAENATKGFEMKCDLLESIKKRFDKEGIEIPFPQRTVHIKN